MPAPEPKPAISEQDLIDQFPLATPAPEEPSRAPSPQDIVEPPAPSGPQIPPMFVMMITPELAPVAKVGGLGDVVYGLARELEMRGNAVEIILPKYNYMRYDHIYGFDQGV